MILCNLQDKSNGWQMHPVTWLRWDNLNRYHHQPMSLLLGAWSVGFRSQGIYIRIYIFIYKDIVYIDIYLYYVCV